MSAIRYLPVAIFATLMGCAGLTLAWEKAAEIFGLPALVSQLLLGFTLVLLAVLASSYLLKFFKHRDAVCEEFNHPIKISFFPALSIGLMLIATALHQYQTHLALILWAVGAALQLVLTLTLMNIWIHQSRTQVNHTTPAWFIPIVGNIIAPIEGVSLGFLDLSWFYFSVGFVYWIVLKVLVFNRMLYHDPLPQNLLPTLFIMVAPPAVGFIAYQQLSGGAFDVFAHILYYTALFLVILLLTQIARFARLPFFISWWAYSFPLAAFTVATMLMYQHHQTLFFQALSLIMLVVVTVLIAMLAWRTARAAISGNLFKPD